ILKLPYAEIVEPFEAWFNKSAGKSRIQYYQGQVITYQFGGEKPFGASFKVTPETTETKANFKECFRVNGTSDKPIKVQSVLPSLTDFKAVGLNNYKGQRCTVLESVSYWGKKKNIYKLWVSNASTEAVPVHYEMQGFNTLLGSHYDKYEIDYTSFSRSFPSTIFDLPHGMYGACSHWPGGGPEHSFLANPMQEFVGGTGEVSRVHEHLFHHYKEKFQKTYKSEKEKEHRKRNFIHNIRYIHSKNPVASFKERSFFLSLQTGALIPLSQQALMDCSWGFGNHACDGGMEWHAYEWIMKHGGIPSTESYGPYLGQNGYCHYNQTDRMAAVSGFAIVPSGNTKALKAALYKHGPVAVNIDASHKSFAFYSSGIYYEPNCGNRSMDLDHAVLAVGYGNLEGDNYWLIKNSWSTYWGNNGYILMSMKENNCGVATAASYPILA
ncbi:hypothetical protein JD844_005479, partial [Phrynosoma platyrhinos]